MSPVVLRPPSARGRGMRPECLIPVKHVFVGGSRPGRGSFLLVFPQTHIQPRALPLAASTASAEEGTACPWHEGSLWLRCLLGSEPGGCGPPSALSLPPPLTGPSESPAPLTQPRSPSPAPGARGPQPGEDSSAHSALQTRRGLRERVPPGGVRFVEGRLSTGFFPW